MREKGVIPAEAGIQRSILFELFESGMPASAGMTNYDTASKGRGEPFPEEEAYDFKS